MIDKQKMLDEYFKTFCFYPDGEKAALIEEIRQKINTELESSLDSIVSESLRCYMGRGIKSIVDDSRIFIFPLNDKIEITFLPHSSVELDDPIAKTVNLREEILEYVESGLDDNQIELISKELRQIADIIDDKKENK